MDSIMASQIKISNLKNIRSLNFDIPEQGVWLLTAGNGAGKTSLLACLRRIGYPNAFATHFPVSLESENLDDFSYSSITYVIDEEEVEYAYRGERWAPRPRKNSHLLARFGYPQVIYIGATAERITPRPEDFAPKRVRSASTSLVSAANQIFETRKFDNLRVVNLTTGAGNQAFIMKVGDNPSKYHSEKNFSLGELCVIKLIEGIRETPNQSLILIDELEMALHPRAQVQLYKYLERVANEKRLTVIFSTHSVSLLKYVPRSRIIFLDRKPGGVVEAVRGCFPTYAIGNITLGEERTPDVVFYVEDEMAKSVLEPLVKIVVQNNFAANNLFPDVRIIPIGGFSAVVNYLNNHGMLMPESTRYCALLDNDVKAETVVNWRNQNNHPRLAEFQRVGDKIDYLPWSPELGILEFLRDRRETAERMLRDEFGRPGITLTDADFAASNNRTGGDLRRIAKEIVSIVAERVALVAGRSKVSTVELICQVFIKEQYATRRGELTAFLMPKLRA